MVAVAAGRAAGGVYTRGLFVRTLAIASRRSALVYALPDGWIYRTGVDGSRPVRLVQGSYPRISPDGRWIFFVRERRAPGASEAAYTLHVTSSDGGDVATVSSEDVEHATWFPDSRRLLVASRRGLGVWERFGRYRHLATGRILHASVSAEGDFVVSSRARAATGPTCSASPSTAGRSSA